MIDMRTTLTSRVACKPGLGRTRAALAIAGFAATVFARADKAGVE